eukprot:g2481.t1
MNFKKASRTGEVKEEIAFFAGVKPTVGALTRTLSAQVAFSSHKLLQAVEGGNIDDIRAVLANTERDLRRSSLLTASYEPGHKLRTPLMCAVRTGDFAIFKTILHAFDGLFSSQSSRTSEMKNQLSQRDNDGLGVAAHAARAGHAVTMTTILQEISNSRALAALFARDHQQMTVVMHAAAAGNAATFQEVVRAIQSALSAAEMADHMTLTSGDDQNLLMIAAASSDTMTFMACVEALRLAMTPHEFSTLIKARDAEGMTLLMHAAHPAFFTSKARKLFPQDNDNSLGSHGGGAPVSRAETARFDDTRSEPGHRSPSSASGVSSGSGSRGHGETHEDAWSRHSLQKIAFKETKAAIPTGNGVDLRVLVLKAAVALIRQHLWKEQVREVLKARDSWGRTLVSHGILSGNPHVFEVTMSALRKDLLDEDVQDLVEGVEQNDRENLLEVAKQVGGSRMATCVRSQFLLLKRDVDLHAKDSTVEAKIQAFIPGKLIVIFQLLLPEVGNRREARLGLLLIISALAPILAWASALVTRQRSSANEFVAGRSLFSYCLAAPAMFVWGTGTSSIFSSDVNPEDSNDPEGFGWDESRSSVVLAVGVIVIPALDVFVNSKFVGQWNDKISFSRWRFSRQAELQWKRFRAQANQKNIYDAEQPPAIALAQEKLRGERRRYSAQALKTPDYDPYQRRSVVDPLSKKVAWGDVNPSMAEALGRRKVREMKVIRKKAFVLSEDNTSDGGQPSRETEEDASKATADDVDVETGMQPIAMSIAGRSAPDTVLDVVDYEKDATEATRGKGVDVEDIQPIDQSEDSDANRPSRDAEAGASRADPEAVDKEAAFQPIAMSVVGDLWEPLAAELQAGNTYQSHDGSVRLEVQGSPGPGPVELHHSAQVLRSDGVDYLVETTVHCPSGAEFDEPLLLDFLLDDPDIIHAKTTLRTILEDYHILFKKHYHAEWQLMGQADMRLMGDGGAMYLRAHISHFSLFTLGKKINDQNGFVRGRCKDKTKVA